MRREVTFQSQGVTCAGWLYLPDDLRPGGKVLILEVTIILLFIIDLVILVLDLQRH